MLKDTGSGLWEAEGVSTGVISWEDRYEGWQSPLTTGSWVAPGAEGARGQQAESMASRTLLQGSAGSFEQRRPGTRPPPSRPRAMLCQLFTWERLLRTLAVPVPGPPTGSQANWAPDPMGPVLGCATQFDGH